MSTSFNVWQFLNTSGEIRLKYQLQEVFLTYFPQIFRLISSFLLPCFERWEAGWSGGQFAVILSRLAAKHLSRLRLQQEYLDWSAAAELLLSVVRSLKYLHYDGPHHLDNKIATSIGFICFLRLQIRFVRVVELFSNLLRVGLVIKIFQKNSFNSHSPCKQDRVSGFGGDVQSPDRSTLCPPPTSSDSDPGRFFIENISDEQICYSRH